MPSKLHNQLVAIAERHLRSTMLCWPVLTEPDSLGEEADAIGWKTAKEGREVTHVIECKASLADFRADKGKEHRLDPSIGMGVYRWFLTPEGLVEPFDCEEVGWGLLEWDGKSVNRKHPSEVFHARNVNREILLLRNACKNLEHAGARTANEARPGNIEKPTAEFVQVVEKFVGETGERDAKEIRRCNARLVTLAGSKPKALRFIKQVISEEQRTLKQTA